MSIPIPSSAAPDVQQAFRAVQTQLANLMGGANQDFHGRRVMNAGKAIGDFDYVTLADMRSAIGAIKIPDLPKTPPPINLYGTHADRTARSPVSVAVGTFFFETDRVALYQAEISSTTGAAIWMFVSSAMKGSIAGRPSDLDVTDIGFIFYAQDQGTIYRWSGAVWHLECGILTATFANRPTAGGTDISGGIYFAASDHGYQMWQYDRVNVRWQFCGGGEPTRGAIGSITGGLGAQDVGYRYHATDFDRVYEWRGAAWADAPGQPTRYMMAMFTDGGSPGAEWALCDGSTVTISGPTGGTTTFTTPDLRNRFVQFVSGATGATGGAATTHTHPVNPPSTTSGNDSGAGTDVAAGAGTTVATHTHTHDTDIASFTSGTPSGSSGDDALPPYLKLRPYVRL